MIRRFFHPLCLISLLCAGTSFAAFAATAKPVAHLYVASNYTGSTDRIIAYAAAANGKLTAVPGSPFAYNVQNLAVNGKYLFATAATRTDIDTFSVSADGSLKQVETKNIEKLHDSNCAQPGALFLDRTGATLYSFTYNADCSGDDDAFQSLQINKSSGGLTYMSETFPDDNTFPPLALIGNNTYGYQASCIDAGRTISGYKRESSGALKDLSVAAPFPTAPENDFYCPWYATADATNHLAVDLETIDAYTITPTGGADQIATYTVNKSNGNLSTTSTEGNMPHTAVVSVTTMSMAPSGKLLAVGGTRGLQIFHFNGAEPVTADTGLLTSDEIDQVFWDNSNHLYAISNAHSKLFVFTVTATSHSEAPGSPYTVTRPQNIAVQPE